ncbi:MAG: hypothetical protein GY772_21555, partial [bacterium]|nr:hypothetical protein [bacterium]
AWWQAGGGAPAEAAAAEAPAPAPAAPAAGAAGAAGGRGGRAAKGGWPAGKHVYCEWPYGVLQYPKLGEAGSWSAAVASAAAHGCNILLRDRRTKSRQGRKCHLVVAGPNADFVFNLLYLFTEDVAKLTLRSCPMARSVDVAQALTQGPDDPTEAGEAFLREAEAAAAEDAGEEPAAAPAAPAVGGAPAPDEEPDWGGVDTDAEPEGEAAQAVAVEPLMVVAAAETAAPAPAGGGAPAPAGPASAAAPTGGGAPAAPVRPPLLRAVPLGASPQAAAAAAAPADVAVAAAAPAAALTPSTSPEPERREKRGRAEEEAEVEVEVDEEHLVVWAWQVLQLIGSALTVSAAVGTEDPCRWPIRCSLLRMAPPLTTESVGVPPRVVLQRVGLPTADFAATGGGAPVEQRKANYIFATTCLRREYQLKEAMAVNLVTLAKYQRTEGMRCRWYVVLFRCAAGAGGASEVDGFVQWALTYCAWALRIGLLRLAVAVGDFRWHAPRCKNTVHRWAIMQEFPAGHPTYPPEGLDPKVLICNLDGDNLLGPEFVAHIHRAAAEETSPYMCLMASGVPGTAGRLVCRVAAWRDLQGYDEDLGPSGYQDMDLRDRLRAMSVAKVKRKALRILKEPEAVGTAIPNDKKNTTWSLGGCKVLNCHPQALQGRSWGAENTRNRVASQGKTNRNVLRRNEGKAFVDLGFAVKPVRGGGGAPPPVAAAAATAAPSPAPAAAAAGAASAAAASSTAAPPRPRPPSAKVTVRVTVPAAPLGGGAPVAKAQLLRQPVQVAAPAAQARPPRLPPQLPRVPIHVVTFGVDKLCQVHRSRSTLEMRDRPFLVTAELLTNALMDCGQVEGEDAVIPVDTRMFHDPAARREGRGHIGVHPSVVGPVVGHAYFPQFVRSVKTAIARADRGTPSTIVLAVFCTSGRHRSVAVATVLAEILTVHEKREVRVSHLCSWGGLWLRSGNCGGPLSCAECGNAGPNCRAFFLRATQLWQRTQ